MSSNPYGGGGTHRNAMSSVDFYRRIPRDLTESTTLGAAMSLCAIGIMAILFLSETIAFARSRVVTSVSIDEDSSPTILLSFNITMLDVHCDYLSLDVWDALGTNRQNVTKNIQKLSFSSDLKTKSYAGSRELRDEVKHDEHDQTLEEMHEEKGVHAIDVTNDNWDEFLNANPISMVDFFAPWCVWCQRLAPTWEKFAVKVREEQMPINVGKVDCMTNTDLCNKVKIMAFPTIRLYVGTEEVKPEYKNDRTVDALYLYAKTQLGKNNNFENWEKRQKGDVSDDAKQKKRHQMIQGGHKERPACRVAGTLNVNRVPGNFHIEAKSKSHNLNSAMTNLTHIVSHLTFGIPVKSTTWKQKKVLKQVPDDYKQFNAFNDDLFLTTEYHQAYHHYMKVVPTHFDMKSFANRDDEFITYQVLEQSQVMHYDEANVPEARFSYDFSPMSVMVKKEGRKWYDYVTSVCAIVGGTFVTLGLIDATLYKVLKPKKL